jgi:hypothetical protein
MSLEIKHLTLTPVAGSKFAHVSVIGDKYVVATVRLPRAMAGLLMIREIAGDPKCELRGLGINSPQCLVGRYTANPRDINVPVEFGADGTPADLDEAHMLPTATDEQADVQHNAMCAKWADLDEASGWTRGVDVNGSISGPDGVNALGTPKAYVGSTETAAPFGLPYEADAYEEDAVEGGSR